MDVETVRRCIAHVAGRAAVGRTRGMASNGHRSGTCPLTQQQLVDEYFIEHRTKVLDIAAFLDRFDRAAAHDAEEDFRMRAFRKALRRAAATSNGPDRMRAVQMLLSDPRTEPARELDRKSAYGAYDRARD